MKYLLNEALNLILQGYYTLSRAIAPDRQRHSRFILATNLLDAERYPAERLLQELQRPAACRTGLPLPQRPLFFASSVFVKKPQRVEALALVMALTLLVYPWDSAS